MASPRNPRSEIDRHWEQHYRRRRQVDAPSPFSHAFRESLEPGQTIVDLGCGDGRDSLFFARLGFNVVGCDASAAAVNRFQESRSHDQSERVSVLRFDLGDQAAYTALHAQVAVERALSQQPVSIYGRFLLHAVPKATQEVILSQSALLLEVGEAANFEYRTGDLDSVQYYYGTHYRRSVDPNEIAADALRLGFSKVTSEVSTEFAPFRDERPLCARSKLVK